MRHKIDEDINVKLRIDIPAEDLADLIELAANSILTIIAAATVAHIFKQVFTKEVTI